MVAKKPWEIELPLPRAVSRWLYSAATYVQVKMSVAYSTWEVASGPTVGYNVGGQSNLCVTEGANNRMHSQQDSVIRGLSALSLCVKSNPEADACLQESRGLREPSFLGKEDASSALTSSPIAHVAFSDEQSMMSKVHEPCALSISKAGLGRPAAGASSSFGDDNYRSARGHGFPYNVWTAHHVSTLDVVSEDRPWESCLVVEDTLEPDCISSSSSLSDLQGDSPCTSGGASHVAMEDAEAQSSYKGPSEYLSSLLASSPPSKKGLSRFYAGKSRSFSCLADVASVKDLAKPENSYARKRKNNGASGGNLDRPRLHPMRTGAVGISKKPPHNNKCTLALAVAMSTKEGSLETEEPDFHASMGVSGRWQSNSAPSRSYSLSDLQGVGKEYSPQ